MRSRDLAYWLQGYFEIESKRAGTVGALNEDQVKCIAAHVSLVFEHEIDPSAGGPVEQAKLDAVHEGVSQEDVRKAIKDTLDKLPRPSSKFHDDVRIRC